jgi:hypothetical protein
MLFSGHCFVVSSNENSKYAIFYQLPETLENGLLHIVTSQPGSREHALHYPAMNFQLAFNPRLFFFKKKRNETGRRTACYIE